MTSTRLIGDCYNGYLHGFDIGAQHLWTALISSSFTIAKTEK
jgi:hypothetical protein